MRAKSYFISLHVHIAVQSVIPKKNYFSEEDHATGGNILETKKGNNNVHCSEDKSPKAVTNVGKEADSSICGREVEIPTGDIDTRSGQKVVNVQGLLCLSDNEQQTTIKKPDMSKERRACVCLVFDERSGMIVGEIDVHKQLELPDNEQDNEINLTEETTSEQCPTGTECAVNSMTNETYFKGAFENDEGTSAERMEMCEPRSGEERTALNTEKLTQPSGPNGTQQSKEVTSYGEDMDISLLPLTSENVLVGPFHLTSVIYAQGNSTKDTHTISMLKITT